jgi:hypothetical protein
METSYYKKTYETYETLTNELAVKKKRLDELMKDVTEIQGTIADLSKAILSLAALLKIPADGEPAGAAEPAASDQVVPSEDEPRYHRAVYADEIAVIFRKFGRSMQVGEIAEEMMKKGIRLPANDKSRFAAVFTAMQRRPNVFEKVRRGRWALTEWEGNPPRESEATGPLAGFLEETDEVKD